MNMDSQWSKQEARFARATCGSLSITTPVSLLANEFDVQSVLHGHVSLAAVNHIMFFFHEAMNSCKILKGTATLMINMFYQKGLYEP